MNTLTTATKARPWPHSSKQAKMRDFIFLGAGVGELQQVMLTNILQR